MAHELADPNGIFVTRTGSEKVLYVASDHPEGEQIMPEDTAHGVTGLMVGDVTEGIAKDAWLGPSRRRRNGCQRKLLRRLVRRLRPQLVTGTWMGYAEGGVTLE